MTKHDKILLGTMSFIAGLSTTRLVKYKLALDKANATIDEANRVNESVMKAAEYLIAILGREGIKLTEFDYLAIEALTPDKPIQRNDNHDNQ